MDELQFQLQTRIKELTRVIDDAAECIAKAPKGSLHIKKNKNGIQYYHRTNPKDTHGIYIRKSEIKFIERLAQKDYAKKIQAKAIIEREILIRCFEQYHPNVITEIYHNLAEPKQKLVTPYIMPDKEYIASWREEKNKTKGAYGKDDLLLIPEDEAIITEGGERVRSKSEKILADKLFMMNIPYVYECPLYVSEYGYINPDFTVLNTRTRKEYVWEHLGLMDQKEYCEKAIKKIETYEKNNMYPCNKLILTYETLHHPLNTKIVEGLIKEYLL